MMIAVAMVLAGLAALVHVYIFVMESLTWTSAKTRAVFGTSAEEAEATKELAYNQGFYNLFLAIVTAAGIVLVAVGSDAAGAALVFAGAGSMAAAAAVLFLSSPDKRGAALKQGVVPLLAVVALLVASLA
jgi:putative membrane protein